MYVKPCPVTAPPGTLLLVSGPDAQPTFGKDGYFGDTFVPVGTTCVVVEWPDFTTVSGRQLVSCLLQGGQLAVLRFNSLRLP